MLNRDIEERTQETLRSLEWHLGLTPTDGQARALYILSRMLESPFERCVFLLKGYAGTGKTSLMRALVGHLRHSEQAFRCLAPTGRAAKVLSSYTSAPAYTIHKQIYRKLEGEGGGVVFALGHNTWKDTVFIIDESSMISNEMSLTGDDLLHDVLEYIFSGDGNRVVFLGDEGQLPPVGMEKSPALDGDFLRDRYGLRVAEARLGEVVRQAEGSGILTMATSIRSKMWDEDADPFELPWPDMPDVRPVTAYELPDVLEEEYASCGIDGVKVICRSNKDAWQFNQQIRQRVLYKDERLEAGERLMIVRNNYLWSEGRPKLPFLANGEMVELLYMRTGAERYGLSFREAGLQLVDLEEEPTLDCTIMLDSLDAKEASMPAKVMDELYQQVRADLAMEFRGAHLKTAIRRHPHLQALQVKYAYAMTCHKAQGGQWPVVVVERGYIPEGASKLDFSRWLYTAVTRATERLYIVDNAQSS
jgi:exodeoxyribonuclease-5